MLSRGQAGGASPTKSAPMTKACAPGRWARAARRIRVDAVAGPSPRAGGSRGVSGVDDQDVLDAREHEGGHRIVDHRLVIDGHQLLGRAEGDGLIVCRTRRPTIPRMSSSVTSSRFSAIRMRSASPGRRRRRRARPGPRRLQRLRRRRRNGPRPSSGRAEGGRLQLESRSGTPEPGPVGINQPRIPDLGRAVSGLSRGLKRNRGQIQVGDVAAPQLPIRRLWAASSMSTSDAQNLGGVVTRAGFLRSSHYQAPGPRRAPRRRWRLSRPNAPARR